jgi:hypothetical protein
MSASVLESIASHLEFLGYEISTIPEKKAFRAKHARQPNLMVRESGGGILFTTIWRANETAKSDRAGFLHGINAMNEQAMVARFYTDHDESDLGFFIEAWYPDFYDKCRFGEFLEVLRHDFHLLGDDDIDMKRFLC